MKSTLTISALATVAAAMFCRIDPAAASPKGAHKSFAFWFAGGEGRLGASITEMTGDLRKYFGAPEGKGVLVSQVEKDSPAAAAGLRAGDVIVEIDGKTMEDTGDVVEAVDKDTGAKVSVAIVRDKKAMTVTATLRERAHNKFPEGIHMNMNKIEIPDSGDWSWSTSSGGSEGNLRKELDRTRAELRALEKRLEKLESGKH
jgi:membrane-associated protease RseP (regulator of RpoE activity)